MRPLLLFFCLHAVILSHSQAVTGRTTGRLPYLNYGLGEDRLGGAKMTYLDSNILVQVVDSTKEDYKVQLSKNHQAYLPKIYFKKDTAAKQKPNYLTASWRIWGDAQYDYVTVALPEKLPYTSRQEINPSRLVVDIFGATSNTNWITNLKTVKAIRNAWYEQVEDDVFRIIIELNQQQHWGHLISYKNNVLQIRVKQQPSSKIKGLKIAVDAGHGGSNSGASGIITKIKEKDYTLKMAQELAAYLCKKGAQVTMTRCGDEDLGMVDRALLLREQEPDLLISMHLNSSGNPAVKGTSTYYRYIGFRPLSQKILDRMLELGLNNFGNVGAFNFSLSGPTEYPNCLVEVAFLSNAEDEQKIRDEAFHKAVAKKIYKGIKDWLKSLD
ncbi:MAG: N-acetylmuramoyl-L-alanine amidase [Bacteroidota bacterium]|nr:N-acetylmuramoyl-L-alanine amidase [Bacteroidota bacterium]